MGNVGKMQLLLTGCTRSDIPHENVRLEITASVLKRSSDVSLIIMKVMNIIISEENIFMRLEIDKTASLSGTLPSWWIWGAIEWKTWSYQGACKSIRLNSFRCLRSLENHCLRNFLNNTRGPRSTSKINHSEHN